MFWKDTDNLKKEMLDLRGGCWTDVSDVKNSPQKKQKITKGWTGKYCMQLTHSLCESEASKYKEQA